MFELGDISKDDGKIWDIAQRVGFLITTKDTDFLELSLLQGAPPKVVFLRTGNVPTSTIERLLRRYHERIVQFSKDHIEAVLIIDR